MSKIMILNWNDESVKWPEDDLQIAIVQYLKREGIDVAADQNAGRRSWNRGAKLKQSGLCPGEPDLRLYLPGGKLVMIEIKSARGSVSKAQRDRHAKLKSLGFPVYIVKAKTPSQAVAMVKEILSH